MPDVLILLARLVLAVVFGVAGWAKLSDRGGTRRAVREFGVPQTLATPVSLLLPLAELIVAALLLFAGSAVWAAIGALMLLGLFTVGILVSLARGRQPDCHCFGQLHSKPVSRATLVRNGVLVGLAVVVIADGTGGANVGGWWIAVVVGVAFGAALGLLVGKFSRPDRLRHRLTRLKSALGMRPKLATLRPGLPLGAEAPAFDLESTAGGRVSLTSLLDVGTPVLLLFTTPDCEMCNELLPEVSDWREQFSGALTVAVIGAGVAEHNREKAAEHGLDRILLQERDEVFRTYGFVGTPSAVVVSTDRKIGSSLVAGVDAVRSLASQAASGQLLAQ